MIGVLALVATVALSRGSDTSLARLAESAARAFRQRSFGQVLDPRRSVRLELPERPSGSLVRGAAAAGILTDVARRALDREVTVARIEVAESRHGLIELERHHRLAGTLQRHRDRVLLAALLEPAGWRIVEVLVVETAPTR